MMWGCSQMTAEEHITSADQLIEKQDFKGAIIELKNAIQIAPDNSNARFKLGKIYLQTKEYGGAEKELNRAMELGYSASQILPLLTIALEKSKADVALSKIDLEQQGMTDDEAVQVAYFKLQSLLRLDKQEEAKRLLRRIKLYNTDSHYKKLALAYEQAIDKNLEGALTLIDEVLAKAPGNPQGLQQKALLLLQMQKPEEAAKTYQLYLDYTPDEPEVMFILAKIWVDLGKTDLAEPIIDKLLKLNPQHGVLNHYKAIARFNDKDYQNALKYAEKAILQDGASTPIRLVAGYSAYALKDYETAQKHLQFAATQLPEGHPALKVLAASQLKLGKNIEAADTIGKLGDPNQDDLSLFTSTSYELLKEGRVKEAKELIDRSEQLGTSANDLTKFGVLQLSLNNPEGIEKLEQAVKMDPSLEEAQSSLAVAYLNTNQLDKAQALAERWQATAPDNIKPYLLKGMLAAKQNDLAAAKQNYQQALAIEPDSKSTQLLLIELESAQGNKDKALQQLETFIEQKPPYMPAVSRYFALMRQQNKTEQGVAKLKSLFEATPDNLGIRLIYAASLLLTNDVDNMLKILKETPEMEHPPELYNRLMGTGLLRNSQIDQALAHYDKWLQNEPENAQALSGKLSILEAQNKNAEGLELVNKTAETYGINTQLMVMRTLFELRLGNYPDAQKSYDQLPKNILEQPIVRGFLAQLQMHNKNFADALPNALAAYQSKPNSYNVRLVVFCQDALGDNQASAEFIKQHLAKHPTDQITKVMLAERQISSDKEAAIQSYEELVKANPGNFLALNNLAYLYNEQGRLDDAEKYAKQAVALLPTHPDALDTLAQIQLAKGNTDQGIRNLAKATDTGKASEEVWLNYIEALLKAGKTELAKRKIADQDFKQPASSKRLEQIKTQYSL